MGCWCPVYGSGSLIFAVSKSSNKKEIKWAIEKEYKVKVKGVRTNIDMKGIKKAYIKLDQSTPAVDITSKLGLI